MIVGILNHEEAVEPLAKILLTRHIQKNTRIQWTRTEAYLESCQQNFDNTKLLSVDFKRVNELLQQDLLEFRDTINSKYKKDFRKLINWLSENIHRYQLGDQYIIDLCVNHSKLSFVKAVTTQLSKKEPQWMLRGQPLDTQAPVVVRNIIGNEKVVSKNLALNKPMWFIDSGYTNFLTGKKTWHRLVRNHIHHNIGHRTFPADRLDMFSSFPRVWNQGGEKILVVESSAEYHQMIGSNLQDWTAQIKKSLSKLTNRPIGFKSKTESRKTRTSVYDVLKNHADEYYCVITHSSAAAIEAIWLGVPVITLGTHISSPVSRNSIDQINDLYRGPIGDWLCALSYCQFTKAEILNGTATKIMKKFHNV